MAISGTLRHFVPCLARGLPFGTELEYANDVTLTEPLTEGRNFSKIR